LQPHAVSRRDYGEKAPRYGIQLSIKYPVWHLAEQPLHGEQRCIAGFLRDPAKTLPSLTRRFPAGSFVGQAMHAGTPFSPALVTPDFSFLTETEKPGRSG